MQTVSTQDHLQTLELGDKTVHLLGTAHVSQASVDEVRQTIAQLAPDVVCVELCEPRYQALTDANRWKNLDIFKVIREGRTLFLLANLAVGAYQRRLGAKLGVQPGAELLAAVEAAQAADIPVELIDRKVDITLKRAWARLGFFKKSQLLAAILESLVARDDVGAEQIEELKNSNNLSAMTDQLAQALPEVKTALIDERDRYMLQKIRQADGRRVLAIVGAAHVPGMRGAVGEAVDLGRLDEPPVPGLGARLIPWIVPALLIFAVVWGFVNHDPLEVANMLAAWAITVAVLTTVGAVASGAKLLTIVVSALASPLTALHPLVSSGMVAGLVEAWLRKPTVADAEAIPEDVQNLRGLYRNAFTRVMLVVVGTTLGTALGSWIGATWVVAWLGGSGA